MYTYTHIYSPLLIIIIREEEKRTSRAAHGRKLENLSISRIYKRQREKIPTCSSFFFFSLVGKNVVHISAVRAETGRRPREHTLVWREFWVVKSFYDFWPDPRRSRGGRGANVVPRVPLGEDAHVHTMTYNTYILRRIFVGSYLLNLQGSYT